MLTGDAVECVPADASLADVARALVDKDIGVVVVGEGGRPAALVSERDVVRAVTRGVDLSTIPALDVASTDLVWCDADSTVDAVANRLMDRYIRHVLVERDGQLVGIVSARDLLGVYSSGAALD
jgi:CBS domain-containing protein